MPPCATSAPSQESNAAAASLLDGEDKDQVHTTEGGDTLAGIEFEKARKARDHESTHTCYMHMHMHMHMCMHMCMLMCMCMYVHACVDS